MKNFSKLLSIIICVAMLLSVLVIVGCNNDKPGEADETTDMTPAVEDTNFEFGISVEGYPYAYTKDDKLEGVCVDVVAAIMNDMEYELELKINDKDQLVQKLIDGEYTGILLENSYVVDPVLAQGIYYSDVIVSSRQIVLTTADSEISKLADLADKKLGTLNGSVNEAEIVAKYGEDALTVYSANTDGIAALKAGEIDAYIVDFTSVRDLSFADEGLKLLASDFSCKDYAICVRTEDSSILSEINRAISGLNDTHKIEAICNEYLLEVKQ